MAGINTQDPRLFLVSLCHLMSGIPEARGLASGDYKELSRADKQLKVPRSISVSE
jgi:hypothetical protein